MPLTPDRLNRIVKASKYDLLTWREGVSLELEAGKSVEQLAILGAAERWRLARSFKQTADYLMHARTRTPRYRSAISRYYYCMYQAMRAAVYIAHGGDDHEEHSKLPSHVPTDFPEQDWQTRLKDARLVRNDADYDPYPVANRDWAKRAKTMKNEAEILLRLTRAYLNGKGCAL